mmetsp:Transcript_28899/g.56723  ORF Transcript_28899/g.56723 Transcript_28899/m.56723 type:complete len:221 (-) Transcript_28899:185-847(-)
MIRFNVVPVDFLLFRVQLSRGRGRSGGRSRGRLSSGRSSGGSGSGICHYGVRIVVAVGSTTTRIPSGVRVSVVIVVVCVTVPTAPRVKIRGIAISIGQRVASHIAIRSNTVVRIRERPPLRRPAVGDSSIRARQPEVCRRIPFFRKPGSRSIRSCFAVEYQDQSFLLVVVCSIQSLALSGDIIGAFENKATLRGSPGSQTRTVQNRVVRQFDPPVGLLLL